MSKKYIDFVPAKKTTKVAGAPKATATRVARPARPAATGVARPARPAATGVAAAKPRVVKAAETKVAKTEVAKPRVMRVARARSSADEIKRIKSQRIVGSRANTTTKTANEGAAPRAVKVVDAKKKNVFVPPKPTFINQNKVVKRPLSGNIYRKEIKQAVAEEPKGPVTIISKQENDKHVGVIVTIILTIILGAAAGTVAFLLLPK